MSLKSIAAHTAPKRLIKRLSRYDLIELQLELPLLWKCPPEKILDFYRENIFPKHCELGVGTGFFLENCDLPANSELTLVDINPRCLTLASERLSQHKTQCLEANVLLPYEENCFSHTFDSVAMNLLLHCLPGDLRDKAVVFDNILPYLNQGGTIFGTTIMGRGIARTQLAKKINRQKNNKEIFFNYFDSPVELHKILSEKFAHYRVETYGSVAFFTAKKD